MTLRLPLLVLLLLACHLQAGAQQDTIRFRMMTYNTENLFDTRNDSLKNDEDFLPEAVRHWTRTRYLRKLDALARVITAVGGWEPPALVALCEVENDSVLHDLTRRSALREAGYRYLVTSSPDERGIDVALLYRRHLFQVAGHRSLPVAPPRRGMRPTRDVLHAWGRLPNGDTLDVFVVHFPSRSQGAKVTEPYRLAAARVVKQAADSLFRVRNYPQVTVLGDFNDHLHDRSLQEVLQVSAVPAADSLLHPHRLYHPLAAKAEGNHRFGSYKYQGSWELIDHILLSGNLLRSNAPLHTDEARADVLAAPFLLTDDERHGGRLPLRTYYGMKYLGGFSDHLPLFVEFQLVY